MIKKDFETWKEKNKCPMCNSKLIKKHEGIVCKNFNCPLYFKLGKGWVYLSRERENSILFHRATYDFDIDGFENKKKWLELKSKILYEKQKCEVCGTNRQLQVHHILPRFSNPELAMDLENLMVLCRECHVNIHSQDKHRFNLK